MLAAALAERHFAYATNGLNQYTAVAGAAHGYDANGNLTSDGNLRYQGDKETSKPTSMPGDQLFPERRTLQGRV